MIEIRVGDGRARAAALVVGFARTTRAHADGAQRAGAIFWSGSRPLSPLLAGTRSQRSCAARKRDPFRALQDQVLRPSTPGSGFVDLLLMRELTTGERGATDVLSMGILGT